MPGLSLWLVPPRNSPITNPLQTLITTTIPAELDNITTHAFDPHVTLTSDIPVDIAIAASDTTTTTTTISSSSAASSAQAWLDGLDLSSVQGTVKVRFVALDTEEPFFRKLNLRVGRDEELLRLAAVMRRVIPGEMGEREVVDRWVRDGGEGHGEGYRPHCSLLYADTHILEERRKELEDVVKQAGIDVQGDGGESGGWEGGRIWLVSTHLPIKDWKPIAERQL